MRTIVVTGGIGSGKSVVCKYLCSNGVPVYDTDSRVKSMYLRNDALVRRIEVALGVELHNEDGFFDKQALADVIFTDSEKMRILEEIVHPAVLGDFKAWRSELSESLGSGWIWGGYGGKEPFVCLESAIIQDKPLFDGVCDYVFWVEAPMEERIRRVMERDSESEEGVRKRISCQKDSKARADVVIFNFGDLNSLYKEVDNAVKILYLQSG